VSRKGGPRPAPAAEQVEGSQPHLWHRTPSNRGHHSLDLSPAPLGWGEAKALVKTACRAGLAISGGDGIIKSNNKTHPAKNPFLKNALEEWWVKPLGQRHFGLGPRSSSSRGGGSSGPPGCAQAPKGPGQEEGPQLQEARLMGGVQRGGRPPEHPLRLPYHPPPRLSTRGAAGSPQWSRRSG